ncbi:MAG: hypothetical protein HN831_01440 [Waddliaceae bacterium]|nr:hypothetical protein [Waddliaceae bacterium]
MQSLHSIIFDDGGFFNRDDYDDVVISELSCHGLLPEISYGYRIIPPFRRILSKILKVVLFPWGLWSLLHTMLGRFSLGIISLLPASKPSLLGCCRGYADMIRENIDTSGEWKFKRLSVGVKDRVIDVLIVCRPSTLCNGRWLLRSNGNTEFYEERAASSNTLNFLELLDTNAVFFNYPGVGASSGLPNRNAMVDAYRALLAMLEDHEGLGATEILGHGFSMGGGIQGDALRGYRLKEGIRYCFIKDRTYSEVSKAVSGLAISIFSVIAKVLGWNIKPFSSSVSLSCPEIIIQTADVHDYCDIAGAPERIIDDGTISATATLAYALLTTGEKYANKYFLGVPEDHNTPLKDLGFIATLIKDMIIDH